ncbi:MAG: 2-C-methyl-D-erythritol 4-phosphate cytidylyltransferase [Candidatus Latescibacteria bacterium]|nr:2-C-methyl-D-erythritol 4-phosphate cytidylyltransferase [Candidatus Latescibacterota bacterium]
MVGHAVLLAAGLGRRLGAGTSKGFVEILGRPLLAWSLETFAGHPQIDRIVVVHAPGEAARARCLDAAIRPLGLEDRAILVEGGERRQDSSARGTAALPPAVRDDPEAVVLIHDAARPLVSPYLITHCLRELAAHPRAAGVLPALPVRETLKRVHESWIEETIDRTGLWAAQTPQAFRLGPLREAQDRAAREGWAVTDDAGLLEASARPLRIVPGDPENLKITYPEDRIFAERLLRIRERT